MSELEINQLATLLANAPMSEKEKDAWIDALPYIPKKDLAKLQRVLEREQKKAESIREKYLAKAEKIVSRANQ